MCNLARPTELVHSAAQMPSSGGLATLARDCGHAWGQHAHSTCKLMSTAADSAPMHHLQMDRFIPARSAIDLDMANLHLTKENQTDNDGPAASSPSKEEYQKMLAGQMGLDNSGRILAFKQKAPAPPEGHDNNLRGLYTENLGPAPSKKQFRSVKCSDAADTCHTMRAATA